MKLLGLICLVVACVVADPVPGVSEWRAEYGAYPTGDVVQLKYDTPILKYDDAILKYGTHILNYGTPILKSGEPMLHYAAPILKSGETILNYGAPVLRSDGGILNYEAPMYYKLAPKAYSLPEGYRVSYDPENFNEAFGFYPDYKK